jgi:hypothetical protein
MTLRIEKMVLAGYLVFQVSAMTVRDIPGIKDNPEDSALAGMIHLYAETYLQSEAENPYSPVSHDSIKTALYTSLSQLDGISPNKNSARHLLLKGLVWHYLYWLDIDSAFVMADHLANSAMKSYPEIPEAAWLKGINMIQASRIKEGFTLLDSLRAGGLIQNQDFLLDYAKLSARCFLPPKRTQPDSIVLFLSPSNKDNYTCLREEERIPFCETWRVRDRSSKKFKMPMFTFGGSYTLSQPLSLMGPPLPQDGASRLKISIDDSIIGRVKTPLLYDPEASKFPMDVKIIADCNNSSLSLPDYMSSIVRNRFDMIKETGDLRTLKAISLRCYNRSVFRNISGEFCAFVAFDLRLSRNPSKSFHESKKTSPSKNDDDVIVRYLIAMKTSDAVEEKAEAIFQDIVCQFDRF